MLAYTNAQIVSSGTLLVKATAVQMSLINISSPWPSSTARTLLSLPTARQIFGKTKRTVWGPATQLLSADPLNQHPHRPAASWFPTPNQPNNALSNCNKAAQASEGDYCYVSSSPQYLPSYTLHNKL